LTDTVGIAYCRLTHQGLAGVARVRAWVTLPTHEIIEGSTNVTFIATTPNSIRISANPDTIDPAESGGVSNSLIRALVVDTYGNLIDRSVMVYFELPEEPELPEGCTWPNRSRIDSTSTHNGETVLSLNAGLRSGDVFLRTITWRDSLRQDTVRAQGVFVRVR
jgi:hypothetical protein